VHLTRLALTDFRCYQAADVAFEPGVTTFTGPNGAGKTNLIEAAGYVATFGSHRVSADSAMVRAGADRAILRAAISGAARDSLVEIELNPGRANRVRLNRAPVPRPRDALGTLRCVLFAPEDLAIVKGDPDQRRRYLDDLLVASRPRYAAVRADYERVLKQRTALLKSARAAGRGLPAGLEIWDEQLVITGAELTAGRLRLVAALLPLMTSAYADVSADPRGVSMTYRQGSGSRSSQPVDSDTGTSPHYHARPPQPAAPARRPGQPPGRQTGQAVPDSDQTDVPGAAPGATTESGAAATPGAAAATSAATATSAAAATSAATAPLAASPIATAQSDSAAASAAAPLTATSAGTARPARAVPSGGATESRDATVLSAAGAVRVGSGTTSPNAAASPADAAGRLVEAGPPSGQAAPTGAVAPPETAAVPGVAELAESMRAGLERVRRAELERAVCLVGPHRDELELRIGELPTRGYASHGESWSMALALRLAAFELLRADGEDPVLMLDDVFAELDAGRRERLAELASAAEQVLVTAAVAADVPARLAGVSYTVASGVIDRAG